MAVTPRYGAALENFEYRRLRAENAKKAANTAEAEYTTIVSGKAAEEARKAALMTEKPLALDEYGHVLTEVESESSIHVTIQPLICFIRHPHTLDWHLGLTCREKWTLFISLQC